MCEIWPTSFVIIKENMPIQYRLSVTLKMKDCVCLQKACHNLWLAVVPFQMSRMKKTLRAVSRKGLPLGMPSGRTPPSLGEMQWWKEQLEGLEATGRYTRILPNPGAGSDGGRGGAFTNSEEGQPHQVHHRGLTYKGGLIKKPWRYWLEMVALCEICQYQRALISSFVSTLSCI